MDRARLNAFSAPGCGVWSNAAPSKSLDKYLTSCELLITVSLQLGVDVFDDDSVCKFCGMVLDKRGYHAMSCTAGGDLVCRHNLIRDIVFRFCQRARLNPELEKAGLLEDESIMVNLRRPADVLADMRPGTSDCVRTALDVKVINALRQGHLQDTSVGGLIAAENYREQQKLHLNTADLCAQRGICYEPLVFTTQGGMERHCEAILSKIAAGVAKNEDVSAAEVKAEITQEICLSLMRSVAKAILRRRRIGTTLMAAAADRSRVEAALLHDADQEFNYQ